MERRKPPISEKYFPAVLGHEKQKRFFVTALTTQRLAHAYLLSGEAHLGKTTFALSLARWLLCTDSNTTRPCGACQSCRLPIENNPDLKFSDEVTALGVEEIRMVQEQLSLSAFSSGRKILIVSRVERLSDQACQALLKFLEEPDASTNIVLTTDNPGALPATLRSRAQIVRFSKVSDQIVQLALDRFSIDGDLKKRILKIARGAIGVALHLASDPQAVEANLRLQAWHEDMLIASRVERLVRGEQLLKEHSDDLGHFLQDWLSYAAMTTGQGTESSTRGVALRLCGGLLAAQRLLDQSVNKRLVLNNLLLEF